MAFIPVSINTEEFKKHLNAKNAPAVNAIIDHVLTLDNYHDIILKLIVPYDSINEFMLDLLVEREVDLNINGSNGQNLMLIACSKNDHRGIKKLLDKKVYLTKDSDGNYPWMNNGLTTETLKILLSHPHSVEVIEQDVVLTIKKFISYERFDLMELVCRHFPGSFTYQDFNLANDYNNALVSGILASKEPFKFQALINLADKIGIELSSTLKEYINDDQIYIDRKSLNQESIASKELAQIITYLPKISEFYLNESRYKDLLETAKFLHLKQGSKELDNLNEIINDVYTMQSSDSVELASLHSERYQSATIKLKDLAHKQYLEINPKVSFDEWLVKIPLYRVIDNPVELYATIISHAINTLEEAYVAEVMHLDRIKHCVLPESTFLYRGIKVSDPIEFAENVLKYGHQAFVNKGNMVLGYTYDQSEFSATHISYSPALAQSFMGGNRPDGILFEINLPKGTNTIYGNARSYWDKEVILNNIDPKYIKAMYLASPSIDSIKVITNPYYIGEEKPLLLQDGEEDFSKLKFDFTEYNKQNIEKFSELKCLPPKDEHIHYNEAMDIKQIREDFYKTSHHYIEQWREYQTIGESCVIEDFSC
jgi:hypothetical protein